jgi:hypothetical protein
MNDRRPGLVKEVILYSHKERSIRIKIINGKILSMQIQYDSSFFTKRRRNKRLYKLAIRTGEEEKTSTNK